MNTIIVLFTLLYVVSWLVCHLTILVVVCNDQELDRNNYKKILLLFGGVVPLYNTYLAYKYAVKPLMRGIY